MFFYSQNADTINALQHRSPEDRTLLMKIYANISKLTEFKPKLTEIIAAEEGNDSVNITVVKALLDIVVEQGCEWVSPIRAIEHVRVHVRDFQQFTTINDSLKFFHMCR